MSHKSEMFQLRQAHLDAFSMVAQENFEVRAVAHLRKILPEQTVSHSDLQLTERVRSGANRARAYGFTSERQLIDFIETGVRVGEHFDSSPEYPWARRILTEPQLSLDDRATVLLGIAIVLTKTQQMKAQG